MARTLWFGRAGTMEVDESLLHVIVANHLLARGMVAHARVLPSALDPELYGLRGLPDTYRVDVDMAAVAREREAGLPGVLDELRRTALDTPHGAQAALWQLERMEAETHEYRARLFAQMKTAQEISLAHVRRQVRALEVGEQALDGVMALSATTLLVIAPYAGAAGYAALGVGTGLRGFGTYRETHDVGRTVVEVSATLVTGVIPLAAASAGVTRMSGAEKAGIAVVGCAFDVGRSAVAGKPIGDWAMQCGFDLAQPLAEKAFALRPIHGLLARTVVPVTSRLVGAGGEELARDVVLEGLRQGADAGTSAWLGRGATRRSAPAPSRAMTIGQLPLVAADESLAERAIRPLAGW
jgi:hypothetical protein